MTIREIGNSNLKGAVPLRPINKDTVNIGGILTTRMNRQELAECIVDFCMDNIESRRTKSPLIVLSSNGQGIALLGSNPEYDTAISTADIVHADGMSVVFASKLFTKTPIRGRSCTTDLFEDLAHRAIEKDLSFYFLGGTEDQNRRAVDRVKQRYPQLRVAGRRHGYFTESENDLICKEIISAAPDVLWVALGKPKQEIWCIRNRSNLQGIGCIKTCGGLYSFLSDDAKRAPIIIQNLGLEWLHRLLKEPRRLGWRYLSTNTISLWRIFTLSKR